MLPSLSSLKPLSEEEVVPVVNEKIMKSIGGQRARSLSSVSSLSSSPSESCKSWSNNGAVDGGSSNKKKPTTLPNETVEYLKTWMMSPEHVAHPYPTEVEKAKIMEETGLELKQLTNWFVNNRKRYWKPRVEARLKEGDHDVVAVASSSSSSSSKPCDLKQQEEQPKKRETAATILMASDNCAATQELNGTTTGSSNNSKNTIRSSKRRSSMTKRKISPGEDVADIAVKTSPVATVLKAPMERICIEESSGGESVSDIVTSSDDDEDDSMLQRSKFSDRVSPQAAQTTEEIVHVHSRRPTGSSNDETLPSLSDVTILQNIAQERILRTFQNCVFQSDDSKKNAHFRQTSIKAAVHVSDSDSASDSAATPKKRKCPVVAIPVTPRPKYRRRSFELWKEACVTADHVYDHDLPSLEEASLLFGYSV